MYCVIKIIVFFNPLCVLMTCRKELITSTVIYGLYVEERESVPQMWTVCTREGITSTDVDCVYKKGNHFHRQIWTVCTRQEISSTNGCGLCVQERESVPLTDADCVQERESVPLTDADCVYKRGNQFH